MSKLDEPVSDEELRRIDKDGNIPGLGIIWRMARELIERRRSEYICPQCGLRNAGNAEPEQDSDGGIAW
jgi:hypothetical protein